MREEVLQYPSGDSRVTVECFSPAVPGKFPAVLLLHGSGGLELATGDLFREIARGLVQEGHVVLIPHYFERTGHAVGTAFRSDDIPSYLEAVDDAIKFAVDKRICDPGADRACRSFDGIVPRVFSGCPRPRIKAIVSVSGSLPVESEAKFPPVLILQGSKDKSISPSRLKEFQANWQPGRRLSRLTSIVAPATISTSPPGPMQVVHGSVLREVPQESAAEASEGCSETNKQPTFRIWLAAIKRSSMKRRARYRAPRTADGSTRAGNATTIRGYPVSHGRSASSAGTEPSRLS